MTKYLVVGTLGLVLALAGNSARAHDEAAYFVLGAIVGSALTRHSSHHATVVYPAPAYPVRVYHAPVYYAPVYHPPVYPVAIRVQAYRPPGRAMVVHHHYRHPHGGPPGKRRHSRGR